MAYYNSYNYHQSYLGVGYQNPYCGNYDIVPSEAFMDYSSHEFNNQNLLQYNPVSYYGAYEYDHPMNRSITAYSVSTFSEPKSIVYDPYSIDCNPYVTKFEISVSEFDDSEFEEYDRTPYGGGYDPDLTYGKPLSPSEEICYPRSSPGSPAALIPSKETVEETAAKPQIERKPSPTQTEEAEPQIHTSTGNERNKEHERTRSSSPEKPSGIIKVEDGHENDSDEDNSYEYYRVPHVPSGYGLEAVDLCESLFGYWPCLAKYNRGRECEEVSKEDISCNQWKDTAADYLFGSSYPYGEREWNQ